MYTPVYGNITLHQHFKNTPLPLRQGTRYASSYNYRSDTTLLGSIEIFDGVLIVHILCITMIKRTIRTSLCFGYPRVFFILLMIVSLGNHHRTLGLYSLSVKTSCHKISRSLEAARFGFKLFQSL